MFLKRPPSRFPTDDDIIHFTDEINAAVRQKLKELEKAAQQKKKNTNIRAKLFWDEDGVAFIGYCLPVRWEGLSAKAKTKLDKAAIKSAIATAR